jgi:hypothetical protein
MGAPSPRDADRPTSPHEEFVIRSEPSSVEESEAAAELAKITPPNSELLKLADRFPAPPEWYEE